MYCVEEVRIGSDTKGKEKVVQRVKLLKHHYNHFSKKKIWCNFFKIFLIIPILLEKHLKTITKERRKDDKKILYSIFFKVVYIVISVICSTEI